MGLQVNCHISLIFSKYCHITYCHIFNFLKKIVIFILSYKNMTIFANCHIFLKIVIFPKYDKKKTNGRVGRLLFYHRHKLKCKAALFVIICCWEYIGKIYRRARLINFLMNKRPKYAGVKEGNLASARGL